MSCDSSDGYEILRDERARGKYLSLLIFGSNPRNFIIEKVIIK